MYLQFSLFSNFQSVHKDFQILGVYRCWFWQRTQNPRWWGSHNPQMQKFWEMRILTRQTSWRRRIFHVLSIFNFFEFSTRAWGFSNPRWVSMSVLVTNPKSSMVRVLQSLDAKILGNANFDHWNSTRILHYQCILIVQASLCKRGKNG